MPCDQMATQCWKREFWNRFLTTYEMARATSIAADGAGSVSRDGAEGFIAVIASQRADDTLKFKTLKGDDVEIS